jgi:hypothetical protein
MANGVTARLPFPEPPSAPVTTQPADKPAPPELSSVLGNAMADAVVAISQAMVDFEADGAMTPASRALGGELLGRVAQLRLDTFSEIDPATFATTALTEGRKALLSRHGLILRQQFVDGAGLEKALDELVGWAVTIAEKVAHDEQVLQQAWAN